MANVNETKYLLDKIGYSLFEIEDQIDINKLILDILKTKDLRLIKSIPFVIYKIPKIELIKNNKFKVELDLILFLTRIIFKKNRINQNTLELNKFIKENISKKDLETFTKGKNDNLFLKKLSFRINSIESFGSELNTEFIMNKKISELEEKQKIYDSLSKTKELDIRFALSKIFKKKQREIIQKIINNKNLTKTEYEYYIRIIKKKLEAILLLNEIAETTLRRKPNYCAKS